MLTFALRIFQSYQAYLVSSQHCQHHFLSSIDEKAQGQNCALHLRY